MDTLALLHGKFTWEGGRRAALRPRRIPMTIEQTETGAVIVTGEADVRRVQHLAQKYAMKLELRTGLTHSGGSIVARIRKHYGFKGSRQSVYDQFCKLHGLEE